MDQEGKQRAHLILGILGNIASCLFFFSSLPTVYKIVKRKSAGGLSSNLYVFTFLNCSLWVFYGLPSVHPDDFWVLLTNAIGCSFTLGYIASYIYCGSKSERWSIIWKFFLVLSTLLVAAILLFVVEHRLYVRIRVIGISCVVISSIMHMTLLSQMRKAIKSRNTKYLQPTSSFAAFFKGLVWTAYAFVDFDVYILIPNGVGIGIACVQVVSAGAIYILRKRHAVTPLPQLTVLKTQSASVDTNLGIVDDNNNNNNNNNTTNGTHGNESSDNVPVAFLPHALSLQRNFIVPITEENLV